MKPQTLQERSFRVPEVGRNLSYSNVDSFLFPDAYFNLMAQETPIETYTWIGHRPGDFKRTFSRYDCSNVGGGLIWLMLGEYGPEGPSLSASPAARLLLERCQDRTELTLGSACRSDIPAGSLVLLAFLFARDETRPPLPPRPEHLELLLLGQSLLDRSFGEEVTKRLDTRNFGPLKHRAVFTALREAYESGKTEEQAEAELAEIPETGGSGYLSLLKATAPGRAWSGNCRQYISDLLICRGKAH